MPEGKWVSKANLQTFWQSIRSKVLPTMIGDTVTTWLTEHVDPVGSAVVVDDTLTIQGASADAKKTGDEISNLKKNNIDLKSALSFDAPISELVPQKGLELVDFQVMSGALCIDGTYNTSDTNYMHLEYVLNGEKSLIVSGYTFGSNYRLFFFLDSNGVIIGTDSYPLASTVIPYKTIPVPSSATKLIVNAYFGRGNYGIYRVTEQDANQDTIRRSVPKLGKLHLSKAYHIINGDTAGDIYLYRELTLAGGETLSISGRHFSDNYPLFLIFDSNNALLYFTVGPKDTNHHNVIITTPTTAKRIIVNGINTEEGRPIIKVLTDFVTDHALTSGIKLTSLLPTITKGKVKRIDGSESSNQRYMFAESNVVGGTTYYITGRSYSDNFPLYLVYDGNENLIDYAFVTNGNFNSNTKYFNVKYEAPLDATKIIINSIKGADVDLKIAEDKTVREVLDENLIGDIYKVEYPVKQITHDFVNGVWVKNDGKSSYNLQFFSKAYAVMLDRIMTTYPNAIVICCNLNETERTTSEIGVPERNVDGKTIKDYNDIIELMAKTFGAILVNHHSCGITYYNLDQYMYDYEASTGFGLHPNAAGMRLIAKQTIKDLQGYEWEGKKLAVFGDSISTFNGTGSTPNQYPAGDVTSVEQTWWHISCIQALGMELLTNGSGGGRTVSNFREGITNRPKSGYNQDAINGLSVNGVSPDVIIIKQGINDFGNVGSEGNLDLDGNYWYGGI